MSIARLASWVAICMSFLNCSSGSGTLNATIAGRPFAELSAISGVSADGQTMFIILTDYPSACDATAACSVVKGGQVLEFALKNKAGAVGLGTYSVMGTSMTASIAYLGCDTTGKRTDLGGVSGSVTLGTTQGQSFDGILDASMNDGSMIRGSFTTSECAAFGMSAFKNCAFGCPL